MTSPERPLPPGPRLAQLDGADHIDSNDCEKDHQRRIDTTLFTRVFLPVFRAVAQLAFELLLRPMVVHHAIDPACAGRIRLASEHVQVRRSHDRPSLVTRHRPLVSRRAVATVARVVPALPVIVAARAARTSFIVPVVPVAVRPPRQPR